MEIMKKKKYKNCLLLKKKMDKEKKDDVWNISDIEIQDN